MKTLIAIIILIALAGCEVKDYCAILPDGTEIKIKAKRAFMDVDVKGLYIASGDFHAEVGDISEKAKTDAFMKFLIFGALMAEGKELPPEIMKLLGER